MKKAFLLFSLVWVFEIEALICIAAEDFNDERPTEHFCPITHCLMTDPVVAADGHTYQREAIQKWFLNFTGLARSPMTNEYLEHTSLVPNFTLRSLIISWKQKGQHNSLATNLTPSTDLKRSNTLLPYRTRTERQAISCRVYSDESCEKLDLLAVFIEGYRHAAYL